MGDSDDLGAALRGEASVDLEQVYVWIVVHDSERLVQGRQACPALAPKPGRSTTRYYSVVYPAEQKSPPVGIRPRRGLVWQAPRPVPSLTEVTEAGNLAVGGLWKGRRKPAQLFSSAHANIYPWATSTWTVLPQEFAHTFS